ncbi:MAG: hypothetical protein GY773_26610 [Actinomycetia bacterium]|nr:hypothetical protein [Actinomycetes bacterium]
MTTWESILRGLVAAARGRGVSHDQEMAKVIDDHANAAQLERVVQLIPPDLEGAPAARLGDPTLMSPQKLRSWLETLAAESGAD